MTQFCTKTLFEIASHYKLNGKECNCFNSERYMFNGDLKGIDLSRKSLESIYTTDSMVSKDRIAFVWADACTFGVIRNCYLTGIGPVSIDMMDKQANVNNYVVPVVILDLKCNKFFKDKLNIDLLEYR